MIPIKKIELAKEDIKNKCETCKNRSTVCYNCKRWFGFINQMANAEIPVDYWFRSMNNFYGYKELKNEILNISNNIDDIYKSGQSFYIAGNRGRGKTMSACSVLKKSLLSGYSAFYINLSDLITRITTISPSLKLNLKNIDFLTIDEIDNRFFPTENSMELYGAQLESLLRSRMQNKLPTIMCSNALDIDLVFKGQFKESFQSLWNQFVKTLTAAGPDARKREEKC